MPGRSKNLRNTSLLSGCPLSQTLIPSNILSSPDQQWVTSRDLAEPCLPYIPEIMEDVTVFLLGNININSSHLFRADILYDSLGLLKTPWQKERVHARVGQDGVGGDEVANSSVSAEAETEAAETVEPIPARDVPGFELTRTVVRRFIPRNPNLDRELEQTCHFYDRMKGNEEDGEMSTPVSRDVLVVYTPHTTSKEDTPYYHPQIRALALLYQFEYNSPDAASAEEGSEEGKSPGSGILSLHFLPFADEEISNRLERTLNALINTQIRLARGTRLANEAGKAPGKGSNRGGGEGRGGGDKPNKDNIIPQHLVQNTYTRLKFKYGPDLCRDWVESTEPSKHVFEDLSITAFLIELWRSMYGVCPADERTGQAPSGQGPVDDARAGNEDPALQQSDFPGFVDVACGNGVLVYVLLMEGYKGWGFDARRRKTWSIFPADVQARLKEEIYIPKPFHDAFAPASSSSPEQVSSNLNQDFDFDLGVKSHPGTFPPNTFIISNHADELTLWTPLMGALSSPESPLPFLAIPCCSHALSGLKYRYPPPKPQTQKDDSDTHEEATTTPNKDNSPQDPTADDANTDSHGSLHALRQAKLASQPGNKGFYKSTYGSLTAKTMSVAQEIGYGVESTLLRIPSTRNMGVIGGRDVVMREWREKKRKMGKDMQTQTDTHSQAQASMSSGPGETNPEEAIDRVMDVVHRECARDGGVASAAQIWVDRARGIHKGPGRGNLNHHSGSEGH